MDTLNANYKEVKALSKDYPNITVLKT